MLSLSTHQHQTLQGEDDTVLCGTLRGSLSLEVLSVSYIPLPKPIIHPFALVTLLSCEHLHQHQYFAGFSVLMLEFSSSTYN